MSSKKSRLGMDPFAESGLAGLIRQTSEEGKQEKPENLTKPEKPSKTDKPSTQNKQGIPENHDNTDKQGLQKKRGPGRPKTSTRQITSSTQEGTREGWQRATYIIRTEHIEKIRDVAYWERKEIKEVMDEALTAYLEGKKVKRRPEGK